MEKAIKHIYKDENFQLSLCNNGYWLYDFELERNISMGASTEQEAFIEALTYYQRRLVDIKEDYYGIKNRVDSFISSFEIDED